MAAPAERPEVDDFGLPIRKIAPPPVSESAEDGKADPDEADQEDNFHDANETPERAPQSPTKKPDNTPGADESVEQETTTHGVQMDENKPESNPKSPTTDSAPATPRAVQSTEIPGVDTVKVEIKEVDDGPKIAVSTPQKSGEKSVSPGAPASSDERPSTLGSASENPTELLVTRKESTEEQDEPKTPMPPLDRAAGEPKADEHPQQNSTTDAQNGDVSTELPEIPVAKAKRKKTIEGISGPSLEQAEATRQQAEAYKSQFAANNSHKRQESVASTVPSISEFSHQQLTAPTEGKKDDDDGGWQTMPAYAPYDIYDDDDKLVAKEHNVDEDETYEYGGLGGAGAGYTKVIGDEDAESETSMDDNTRYLFNNSRSTALTELEEEQRDAVSQLQATKDLLTEGQRIAYVGVCRLEMFEMVKELEAVEKLKRSRKEVKVAADSMRMWAQKMMIRLYSHMDISPAEQIMIEQLVDHGVRPEDLTPVLMQNARVKNPKPSEEEAEQVDKSKPERTSTLSPTAGTPRLSTPANDPYDEPSTPLPTPYEKHDGEELPESKTPSQLPDTAKIEIDLRWTVICDLFLVLIADSIYDSRSRYLLERVGKDLEVPWVDICRFEKRVTEALEMQQQAEKENWNEEEHVETRRKAGVKRRYAMMGLATVGGGLVIGLSGGLMAPMIGAGLAAGFTAIGVGGTSAFLAGVGGAAVITSGSVAAGSFMGGKAANRRLGSVKTFEYRPLHNNKRPNLIVTVSGWMTNKHDDIRLPFSTVDPSMGDLYSILWEPEILQSIGDTINILATEAVTSTLQQVLGAVGLAALMSGLQLPILMAKITYLIDNPWAVSLDRAWSAGQILADSLIDRNLGTRPVTLVGYSLGARVIFACLLELEKKGAYGLVQNVYMFGSPIVVKHDEFMKARSVVSGRWVNGYSRTDWILGYLFRLTNGGIRRVGGLAPVEGVPGVENIDCSEWVVGHMEYRTAMPKLLRESGWLIESDEFDEIEDPDPDGHRERQREIINEIEEARKEMEKKGNSKKSSWNIFGRKKTKRESWEVYEDNKGGEGSKDGVEEFGVMFDSEMTRREMAAKAQSTPDLRVEDGDLHVKELKSTLPPIKLDAGVVGSKPPLRETRSSSAMPSFGTSTGAAINDSPWANDDRGRAHEAEEVQMSFDTDFHRPTENSSTKASASNDQPWATEPSQSPRIPQSPEKRPDFKSTYTAPPSSLHTRQPWDDDDDDPDFGKEKEIEMTFA